MSFQLTFWPNGTQPWVAAYQRSPMMEALEILKTFKKRDAMGGPQAIREYGIPCLSFSLFPGLAYETLRSTVLAHA